jgi:hypothetical protein
VKVFISSVIRGFEPFRDAVASAAKLLGHEVLRSEDLAAGPDPAERACLDLVRRADVVVLVLGARYGAPSGRDVSPTHEEYREARSIGRDVLGFVQGGVAPEPKQRELIDEARQWATGSAVATFATPAELRDQVVKALKELELSRAGGRLDPGEMVARAAKRAGEVARAMHQPSLLVAVGPGPAQALLRPTEIASEALQRDLEKEALYGRSPVLVRGAGVKTLVDGGSLVIAQDRARIVLDPDGTLVVAAPAEERDHMLSALIEETIRERVAQALTFAGAVYERIDARGRVTDIAPVASLANVGYTGWRTRAEQERDPNRLSMNVQAPEGLVVGLRPETRRRRALTAEANDMAEDLTELLHQAAIGRGR